MSFFDDATETTSTVYNLQGGDFNKYREISAK